MRILIAEDDNVSRMILRKHLENWNHQVIETTHGRAAWDAFQKEDIQFMITDWMMPEMDGPELIRLVRSAGFKRYTYIILLTAKASNEDLIEGMESGADDFITKPFDKKELYVRIQAGQRVLALEKALADKVHELEQSIEHIRTLQKLLPICMYCKKIRSDDDYWQQVDEYLAHNSQMRFSHGICPECHEKLMKDLPEIVPPHPH
jgi:phosphoserine phosphatase RsbU/P